MLFATPPLSIVDHPADSIHCCGVSRSDYRYIVIHATGGTDSLDWLSTTSPPNKPVSSHRLIAKDGTIYKIVPDDKVAYTQGPAKIGPLPGGGETANNYSLSIELENLNDGYDPYTSAQLDACAAQVVEWIGAYGFIPIVFHRWIQSDKSDPAGFPRDEFYERMRELLKAVL